MTDQSWGLAYHAGMWLLYDHHGVAVATFAREQDAQFCADAVNGSLAASEIERLTAELAKANKDNHDMHKMCMNLHKIDEQNLAETKEHLEFVELELSVLRGGDA